MTAQGHVTECGRVGQAGELKKQRGYPSSPALSLQKNSTPPETKSGYVAYQAKFLNRE